MRVLLRAVTYYTLDSVLLAFGLTCIVTCALTALVMKTDIDFTAWTAGYVRPWIWFIVSLPPPTVGDVGDGGFMYPGHPSRHASIHHPYVHCPVSVNIYFM